MELSLFIVLLALAQFTIFAGKVGVARPKFDVAAPKTEGHDLWERTHRIHQNTMEQLVIFIPSILMFSYFIHDLSAAIIGIVFLISRHWYAKLYLNDPSTRGRGFAVTFAVNSILMAGAAIGIGLSYFGYGNV